MSAVDLTGIVGNTIRRDFAPLLLHRRQQQQGPLPLRRRRICVRAEERIAADGVDKAQAVARAVQAAEPRGR